MKINLLLSLLFIALLNGCASIDPYNQDDFSRIEQRYISKPDSKKHSRTYVQALIQRQDFETASHVVECLIQREDPEIEDYVLAARIHEKLGDKEKQISLLRSAFDQDTSSLIMRERLITAYKNHEQLNQAQRLYDDLLYCTDSYDLDEDTYARLVDESSLNLIAQSLYSDAFDLVKNAKQRYPDNIMLERNSRIISALMQSNGHNAPKPEQRPSSAKPSS